MLRLRAFKATDDPESCAKFLKGHGEILTSIGVNKVTSSKASWVDNPGTYVIVVEDPETGAIMGGARVDTTHGNQPLPIEEATGYMDEKVYEVVKRESADGAGEICGLWNSRKVAGLGFGSIYLSRAAVAISPMANVENLFGLAAPYTIATAEYFGYKKLHEVGNDGTFYYPKLDLIATALLLKGTTMIHDADNHERERIFSLREDPKQEFTEENRRREVDIQYDLEI